MRKHIYLNEKSNDIILKYQEKNNISSFSKALNEIIEMYNLSSENTIKNMYEYMADRIAEQLKEDVKNSISKEVTDNINPTLKSLKYSSNSTNRNTQIMLELLNGIYYKEKYGIVPSISQKATEGYTKAVDTVDTEIAKKHYKNSHTLD